MLWDNGKCSIKNHDCGMMYFHLLHISEYNFDVNEIIVKMVLDCNKLGNWKLYFYINNAKQIIGNCEYIDSIDEKTYFPVISAGFDVSLEILACQSE